MILFWVLAGLFVTAIMFQVLRPLWFGQKVASDERIPLAVYRDRLGRLERDVAAGRLDPKEASAVREQLGQELLEQVEDADPPAEPARHRPMAIVVSVLVAALAIGIYLSLGNPGAVTHTEHVTPDEVTVQAPSDGTQAAPSLQDAVTGLENRLQQNPDNVEDWLLLGRSYAATDRWNEAATAIKRALDLTPERADITVDYAEALARVQDARLEGEPRRLLEHALELDPVNAKAAWLLGMALYQEGAFSEAADLWDGLLAGIPADNPAREGLSKQIADARRQAGEVPGESPGDTAQAPGPTQAPELAQATATASPGITVEISLAPNLAGRVNGTETMFVYARAAEGPPMPLAVQRMGTGQFPVTVTLDESMAMMPGMSLASFPEIVVGARISQNGSGEAQPGDLEALSDPLPSDTDQPVMLVIDHIVQ